MRKKRKLPEPRGRKEEELVSTKVGEHEERRENENATQEPEIREIDAPVEGQQKVALHTENQTEVAVST